MSGSAGLSLSRNRKPEGSTLSGYARNLRKECAGLVAGQAVLTAEIRTADTGTNMCGVEVWRGSLGGTYRLPTLSVVGASLFPPCFRFHTPLIEPDVRICRIRLSEKTHAIAEAIACDAVCNFQKQLGSCQACRQSPFLSPLLASAVNWPSDSL